MYIINWSKTQLDDLITMRSDGRLFSLKPSEVIRGVTGIRRPHHRIGKREVEEIEVRPVTDDIFLADDRRAPTRERVEEKDDDGEGRTHRLNCLTDEEN